MRLAALPDALLRRAVPNLTDSSPGTLVQSHTTHRDKVRARRTGLVDPHSAHVCGAVCRGRVDVGSTNKQLLIVHNA